jgi:Ser/Thr protein kinase RdoA (MazF antagonist)
MMAHERDPHRATPQPSAICNTSPVVPIGDASGRAELAAITGTELAIYGAVTTVELLAFLDVWTTSRLGSSIARVRFRAGRINVVWGVDLANGRAVVIKTHRPPADVDAIRVTHDAQRVLVEAGFPCALPLAGPEDVGGHVLTAETLMPGTTPNGRNPGHRLLLADGLARHIDILRDHADLVRRAGVGPSWCRYQAGPWPEPHDTVVDFRSTPAGFEWLDAFGRRAADQVLAHREPEHVVVGHADWYAGNTAVSGDVLTGTFDWELVADTEAVIAGMAAACYGASCTGSAGLSTPEEAVQFLCDYDGVRSQPLRSTERRAAAGAAAWILAFNARWQVALIDHGHYDEALVSLVRRRGEDYLSLDF